MREGGGVPVSSSGCWLAGAGSKLSKRHLKLFRFGPGRKPCQLCLAISRFLEINFKLLLWSKVDLRLKNSPPINGQPSIFLFIDLNIQIIFQQYPFPPHLSRVWYRLCFCPVPHLTRGPGPNTDMQISQHSIYWTFHFSFNQLLLSDSKIDFITISCFQTNKGSRIQILRMPQLLQELIKQNRMVGETPFTIHRS